MIVFVWTENYPHPQTGGNTHTYVYAYTSTHTHSYTTDRVAYVYKVTSEISCLFSNCIQIRCKPGGIKDNGTE